MDEEPAWTCECGYGELAVEGDPMATLRRWAAHVREAHGEDALNETLRAMVSECMTQLTREGTTLRDPFTGGEQHRMGKPPSSP